MPRKNKAHILASLALLAVFAVALFGCLLAGAKSYRRISRNADLAYTRRTAAAYLHTQLSRAGEVRVEPFGEGTSLCLTETVAGERYTTRIYCQGGWLMELFAREGSSFAPEDGNRVLALESLEASWDGDMLILRLRDDTGEQSLRWLGCGESPHSPRRDGYEK